MKEGKLKITYFSHIQRYQRLSLSVGIQLDAQLSSKGGGREKGQTMPGTQCRAHASLGHGSLFRRNNFSNKFILLKTIACIQNPQKVWELYCHGQQQAISINAKKKEKKEGGEGLYASVRQC